MLKSLCKSIPKGSKKVFGSGGSDTVGSGAIMRFRLGSEKKELYVEPNTIYIMSGDARYKWTHEMPSNFNDVIDGEKIKRGRRISITFRNVPKKSKKT